MSHDAWTVGNGHIYNYNETRGLVRATINAQGKWEKVVASNATLTGLKSVSIVLVGKRLLLRHSGSTVQPFTAFACETLEELPR